MVPPVEQWRSEYVFLTPGRYAFDFISPGTYDIAFTFANDGFIRDVFEERVTRAEVVVSSQKQLMTMRKNTR
jgi:hypothetical protein